MKQILSYLFIGAELSLFAVSSGHAATYYVSTSGSDSNPGTLSQPWQTVHKAATTMSAGDTTFVRGGTYTENTITFANSGAAGSIITIAAFPGEIPIIDSGLRVASGRAPVFWIAGVSYITLDGLTIQYGSTANIYLSYNVPATHITIQNCNLNTFIQNDNGSSIYMDPGSDHILVQNNYIHDYITGGYVGNAANGIIMFQEPGTGPMNVTIQNNEIYGNLLSGIYYKHSDTGDTTSATLIKNNFIHIAGNRSIISSCNRVQMTNNVIYGDNPVGITLFIAAGPGAANDNVIVHNTILTQSGISITDQQFRTVIRDNLISDITTAQDDRGIGVWHYGAGTDTSNTTIDHTLVYSAQTTATVYVPAAGFVAVDSLPVTILGRIGNIAAAPIFINAGANNYALAAASPGHNAASDGTDMGAQICAVGVNASCTASIVAIPARPIGLVLQ